MISNILLVKISKYWKQNQPAVNKSYMLAIILLDQFSKNKKTQHRESALCVCMCSTSRQGRERLVYLDNTVLFFSLRELLQSTGYHDIFQEEMGFDLVVFRGLLRRRKSCKMTCLDLRGFKLSKLRSCLGLWSIIVFCFVF